MINWISLAIGVMGFSGLIAQILLIRELLIIFSGNELSIGIVVANWLILESWGCFFISKKAEQARNPLAIFTLVTTLFILFLFAALFITRILKLLLGVSLGESIGFIPMFFSTLIILMPVSITHGALFPLSCRIYNISALGPTSVGRIYAYETIGTIIGGAVGTFILFPLLNSFSIISYLALLNFIVCLILLITHGKSKLLSKGILIAQAGLIFLTGFFILSGGVNKLQNYTIKNQFRNQKVVHYQNSMYSNFCILENQGQYFFFIDGIPEIIIPIPDVVFVDEFVHLPLLTHPEPKEVLIISGGAGGVINEVLKHGSIEKIEYVELDPLLLKLLKKFSTPLTAREMNDKRVKIGYIDGRMFLRNTEKKYDLIFLGITEPATLQTNRFFTKEFFSLVKTRLKSGGIFVLGLPGSLDYLTAELKNLNGCIFNTLKSVFMFIKVIPGEKNLFFASDTEEILGLEKSKLIAELNRRGIKPGAVMPRYIEQKLHPQWQDWFLDLIKGGSQEINFDFKPIGLYYNITHWVSLFEPGLRGLFNRLEKLQLRTIIMVFLIFLFVYSLLKFKKMQSYRITIPLIIFTSGFAGMIFDLMLVFAFQSIYGYVFSWIGILTASFMAGTACGAMAIIYFFNKIKNYLKLLKKIDLSIIFLSLGFPLIFFSGSIILPRIVFLVLAFICGFLIGAQFPLANAIYPLKNTGLIKTAGLLYASDLLGGWIGGILGAIVFLPVLGIIQTGITVALLKVFSLIVFVTQRV